jgi:RNA polymerase sigma-70 factor (ECF subfamily)
MPDTCHPTDSELVARVVAEDGAALAELYRRHASIVLGLSLRILSDRSEAEDAVHDTFVHVFVRARGYTLERGAVLSWLVTIARNTCIDRLRRRKVARGVLDATLLEPPQPTRDPEALVVDLEQRERVLRALATLSSIQRATLDAAFFRGDTYAQIATREGLSLGTIKSRAARALAALAAALEAEVDVSHGPALDPLSAPAAPMVSYAAIPPSRSAVR